VGSWTKGTLAGSASDFRTPPTLPRLEFQSVEVGRQAEEHPADADVACRGLVVVLGQHVDVAVERYSEVLRLAGLEIEPGKPT
jgi:hypothetical protein